MDAEISGCGVLAPLVGATPVGFLLSYNRMDYFSCHGAAAYDVAAS